MKNFTFTYPKLAFALIARIIAGLVFCGASIFVCKDFLIFALPFVINIVGMAIIACISLYRFSFAVFRSLILVKFDDEGIKNSYCKIKYKEIAHIGYENIEFASTRGHKKFGIILIINGKDKDFKSYDIKNSICIPLNKKTKKALIENAPLVAEKFNISL